MSAGLPPGRWGEKPPPSEPPEWLTRLDAEARSRANHPAGRDYVQTAHGKSIGEYVDDDLRPLATTNEAVVAAFVFGFFVGALVTFIVLLTWMGVAL